MRSLLMYEDRDFDPDQAFADLMYRYRRPGKQQPLPSHQQDLIQDLELNTIIEAMADGDEFLSEVVRDALLSGLRNNVRTVVYRQGVLKDCMKEQTVIRQLHAVAVEAIEQTKRKWWSLSSSSSHPSSLIYDAIQILEGLSSALRNLRTIAVVHGARFESKAFANLFSALANQLSDDYLALIQASLTEVRFRKGVLLSAKLGEWNESTGLVLHKLHDRGENWLQRTFGKGPPAYTFRLHERDHAGGKILSDMRNRGISRIAAVLAQSADHVLGFFKMLRTELAFYVGCLNLHDRLAAKGEPVCFPTPTAPGERKRRFRGIYDVSLALHMDSKVVGNTINADSKSLVIITGANHGGKSSFLRSIGLAQIMMQCGMFVGAESFAADLCPELLTHYKREEDATMRSGKFDEELSRMSAIVPRIVPNSLLLFNESFAATNEREGSEIARQIVSALIEKQVNVLFVTHLYEFASTLPSRRVGDTLFLRAERKPDGTRTFKLVEGEPFETSYGEDLYRQVFGTGDASLSNRIGSN